MARFGGFVGPSYASQSPNVSADRCVNFYPEIVEQSPYKTRVALYPTPGLSLFTALVGSPVRGLHLINDRVFAVAGPTLYEVFGNGTSVSRGTVANDGLPVSMASSTIELCIASGGTVYILTLATNVLTAIAAGTLTDVSQVAYIDGFFLALIKNSQIFRISAALNGLSWPGGQVIQVSVFPDNVVSMIADHRELWLLGKTKSVVYFDSGSAQIFDVIPGAFIEQGCGATFSSINLDNTIGWLGADERGAAIAWRAEGYTPKRVSNHAVEFAWQQYTTISDAIAYPYQDQGHSFAVVYFPTPDKTWVFDAATGMWHERGFLNLGVQEAHLGRCHVYAFGKHLVGDRKTGNVYEMSISFLDDNGSPIRRVRRAPHVSAEQKWLFFHQLQVDIEAGVAPIPPLLDGAGNPRPAQAMLRWSDDSAKTWSNEHAVGFGEAGEYKTRLIWRRLGRSRDRIFEVSFSDPVPIRIADAYIEVSSGSGA